MAVQKASDQTTNDVKKAPVGTYIDDGTNFYYFDIVTKEEYSARNNYTDHYCEDGSVIQDHVVFEPVRYVLTGLVAEKRHVYDKEPLKVAKTALRIAKTQDIFRKVQTYGQFVPTLSSYVYSAINAGRFIYDRINTIIRVFNSEYDSGSVNKWLWEQYAKIPDGSKNWKILKPLATLDEERAEQEKSADKENVGLQTQTSEGRVKFDITLRQEYLYADFERLRKGTDEKPNPVLVTLHSPYGEIPNMVVESFDIGQTQYMGVSDVTVVLKQLRFFHIEEEKTKSVEKDDREQQLQAPQQEPSLVDKAKTKIKSGIGKVKRLFTKKMSDSEKKSLMEKHTKSWRGQCI